MRPGPRPKPEGLRALQGYADKRPKRTPPKAAAGETIMPEWLTAPAGVIWDELAPGLAMMDCLGDVDRRALATACRLQALGDYYGAIAEAEVARPKPAKRPSPALWVAVKCWEKALAIFARFGITPAERSRIALGGARADEDELETFRQRKTRPA